MLVRITSRSCQQNGQRIPFNKVVEWDEATAKAYIAAGQAAEHTPEVVKSADEVDLDKLKKDELVSFATENGIELGEAKTKAEILNVIEAALVE